LSIKGGRNFKMQFQRDPNRLEIYTEIRKSKLLVGQLSYDEKNKQFVFVYERKYLLSKSAIPLGPELPLKKRTHASGVAQLFPSLSDRIPSRENPAYDEYCQSQGISPQEKNPIILLTTIGRRGPSTFVFEPVYMEPDIAKSSRLFRIEVGLSLREMSAALDINLLTLIKIETGKSRDKNTLRLLSIYLNFPEVALWAVRKNERKLHHNTARKLITLFEKKIEASSKQREL